jgi:hypothetical protein
MNGSARASRWRRAASTPHAEPDPRPPAPKVRGGYEVPRHRPQRTTWARERDPTLLNPASLSGWSSLMARSVWSPGWPASRPRLRGVRQATSSPRSPGGCHRPRGSRTLSSARLADVAIERVPCPAVSIGATQLFRIPSMHPVKRRSSPSSLIGRSGTVSSTTPIPASCARTVGCESPDECSRTAGVVFGTAGTSSSPPGVLVMRADCSCIKALSVEGVGETALRPAGRRSDAFRLVRCAQFVAPTSEGGDGDQRVSNRY